MEWLNYMQPSYDANEIEAVNEYMQSKGWLTEFKKTREFENSIREYVGSTHCSVMTNGTVTLMAALMACGIQPGDEVIVPDFTMSATAHAAKILGAQVVFADVERETLCMDFDSLQNAISPKTKAVIFVDLNGRCSERFSEIISFCKEKNLWFIEDAAQALGSSYHGKALGTFGDIGSFSFSMPKIITTGQGGAIVTDNAELFDKVLKIRDFGREKTGSDHYIMVGGNFKFTDVQAVIGIEQMKKLVQRVDKKKQIGAAYDACLQDVEEIELIKNDYRETAPCFIEILCKSRKAELMQYLKGKNIGTRSFYPPLHSEPAYQYKNQHFPVAEEISRMGMWLPSFADLTTQQIEYICSCIREFYRKK